MDPAIQFFLRVEENPLKAYLCILFSSQKKLREGIWTLSDFLFGSSSTPL
jgi:hypothetical protein